MLGRSWCPCRRDAGIADAVEATGSLCLLRPVTCHPDPLCFRVGFFTLLRWTSWPCSPRPVPWRTCPPSTLERVFTAWTLDPLLTVLTVWAAGLYLVGVWVLRERGRRTGRSMRTLSFVVSASGALFFATSSGLADLRHDAAVGAHGPAHGAVDDGAAVPRARGAGDAGAAHPAAPAAPVAARRAALPGGAGADLRAADLPAVRDQPVGALLHRLVRRLPALDVRARGHARAPRARRVACSSGRWSAWTRCPDGSATRSGCC